MVLTNEIIQEGKNKNNSWTRSQLEIIGVEWPPKKGWKNSIINSDIPTWRIKIFLALKDWKFVDKRNKPNLDQKKLNF